MSSIFGLGREQPELDFVDIDPSRDLGLYVDPYLLATEGGLWARRASATISAFFTHFFALIRENRATEARSMFLHLGEPNETCLGLSRGKPSGRGVGAGNANELFASMQHSRAVESGLVHDLEDAEVFIPGIGPDKVSDMVTNIIRGLLVEYTLAQCKAWSIPTRADTPTGFLWDPDQKQWTSTRKEMLTIQERKILLVPKWAVSTRTRSPRDTYHREYLLEYERSEQLSLNGLLVRERRNGTRYVTDKDLIEHGHEARKAYLVDWTTKHYKTLEEFRSRERPPIPPVPLQDWVDSRQSLSEICQRLQTELRSIPPGTEAATRYHRCVGAILDLAFYPELGNLAMEEAVHDGRKRIDVMFDNLDTRGFFFRAGADFGTPCPLIVVECKNYSRDVANPELDQMIGRFSRDRGRIGLLVCRTIDNMDLFLNRCHDTLLDGHGLILPLVDEDLQLMLENLKQLDERSFLAPPYESLLNARRRAVTLGK